MEFAAASPRALDKKTIARSGLTESVLDTEQYGALDPDPDFVMLCIWLSFGNGREREGSYRARSEEDPTPHAILPYTTEWRPLGPTPGLSVDTIAAMNEVPRARCIHERDAWCTKNPGRVKEVNVAMDRPPSPYPHLNFFRDQPVSIKHRTDQYMLEAVVNGIALL